MNFFKDLVAVRTMDLERNSVKGAVRKASRTAK